MNFHVPFNSLKSPAFSSYKQTIKVFQGVDLVSSQNSFKNAILNSGWQNKWQLKVSTPGSTKLQLSGTSEGFLTHLSPQKQNHTFFIHFQYLAT